MKVQELNLYCGGRNYIWKHSLFLDGDGLRRSDVVNWYLKEIESEIETEEELAEKKYLVDKVLNRLIDHVSDKYLKSANTIIVRCWCEQWLWDYTVIYFSLFRCRIMLS